jgi:hypothetical protein
MHQTNLIKKINLYIKFGLLAARGEKGEELKANNDIFRLFTGAYAQIS